MGPGQHKKLLRLRPAHHRQIFAKHHSEPEEMAVHQILKANQARSASATRTTAAAAYVKYWFPIPDGRQQLPHVAAPKRILWPQL